MKEKIIKFIVFVALWVGFAYLFDLLPISEFTRGAFAAAFTISIYKDFFN